MRRGSRSTDKGQDTLGDAFSLGPCAPTGHGGRVDGHGIREFRYEGPEGLRGHNTRGSPWGRSGKGGPPRRVEVPPEPGRKGSQGVRPKSRAKDLGAWGVRM